MPLFHAGMKNIAATYIRPETAINKYVDQDWRPYIQTPPFPSYTSGHATISAAAAEVMTNWFGDHLSFTDTSSLEFGIKSRRLRSFRAGGKRSCHVKIVWGYSLSGLIMKEGNKCGKCWEI